MRIGALWPTSAPCMHFIDMSVCGMSVCGIKYVTGQAKTSLSTKCILMSALGSLRACRTQELNHLISSLPLQSVDSEDSFVPGRRASLSDLTHLEDIEGLTVRQLKEILARNFVNYKGCCEKWELMERVTRLYKDQKGLQHLGEDCWGEQSPLRGQPTCGSLRRSQPAHLYFSSTRLGTGIEYTVQSSEQPVQKALLVLLSHWGAPKASAFPLTPTPSAFLPPTLFNLNQFWVGKQILEACSALGLPFVLTSQSIFHGILSGALHCPRADSV